MGKRMTLQEKTQDQDSTNYIFKVSKNTADAFEDFGGFTHKIGEGLIEVNVIESNPYHVLGDEMEIVGIDRGKYNL